MTYATTDKLMIRYFKHFLLLTNDIVDMPPKIESIEVT